MKVVCLGDSFTRGFGVSEEQCWVNLLNKKIEGEFVNKGVSGDTTGGMLARFYRDVVDEKPRYVLIGGGFNDFLAGVERSVCQGNLMSLVHQAYHNSIIPILIIEPCGNEEQFKLNWSSFVDIDEIQKTYLQYREWIKGFSRTFDLFYIDLYAVTNNSRFRENYYIDGIHITPEGHEIVADAFVSYFSKI